MQETKYRGISAIFTNKYIQRIEHPGVKSSHCEAAIGVMAVKKTKEGIYLYFCHNTESFVSSTLFDCGQQKRLNDYIVSCVDELGR